MPEFGPQPGPQELFLSTPADIAIYGGAAGGGKTFALLMEPLRHVKRPDFGAVMFRRTFPQITQEGAMWDQSVTLYSGSARPNQSRLEWRWPSGARVSFEHMQYETDKLNYQGAQIPLIGFDQLESFSEAQFFYMLSRNRSVCGVRPYMRGTCNPDADSWLAKFISWWIDDNTGYPIMSRAGRMRWFIRIGSDIKWADRPEDLAQFRINTDVGAVEAVPKSVTFVPARIYDNKILMAADPGYLASLMALPEVERERLLAGNWKIRPEAGKVFNRDWFKIIHARDIPVGGVETRFWDFAATDKEQASSSTAYTAGVRILRQGPLYIVMDCEAGQWGPAESEKRFIEVSRRDAQEARKYGRQYRVRWEIEPGSAAKRDAVRLQTALNGLDAQGVLASGQGDKLVRARALQTQSMAGNVKLRQGEWNDAWLNHMHNQPETKQKDIMDASAGAYNDLTNMGWTRGAA